MLNSYASEKGEANMRIISRPIALWRKRWFKALIYGVILIGFSIGLAYVF